MTVKQQDIEGAIRSLNLSKQVVCLHSSLRSFGHVDGGAITVVSAFLKEGCTLLVPTFSSAFEVAPPPHLQFERNGWTYTDGFVSVPGSDRIYTPDAPDIDRDMGAIPVTIVALPDLVRGNHPLDSFTAIGPRAAEIMSGQAPWDVYAPLVALVRIQGFVLTMGVGLERMTLLHLAEKEAGRILFRRWAKGPHGETIAVEVGGCSEGFGKLEPYLRTNMQTITVGESMWRVYPADKILNCAAEAIRANPLITHCGLATCERCNDAVAGGPILNN